MTVVKQLKISSKGQITLPQAVRKTLASDVIQLVMENGLIRIEPSADQAGTLKQYAKRRIPPRQARDKAWKGAIREKYGRR
jgi:bifunctional DNA-binding transcriptional regulator/antitoxin component of YhaV-PrlF toxin-antitoxin module